MATATAIAGICLQVAASGGTEIFWFAGACAVLADRHFAAQGCTSVILVNDPIAIIVYPIALLRYTRMNRRVTIVAIVASANLRRMTIGIFVEQVKGTHGARGLALDVRFAGVILPRRNALIRRGTRRCRHAPAIERTVLTRRTGSDSRSWSDRELALAPNARIDGAGVPVIAILRAGWRGTVGPRIVGVL